MAEIVMPRLSDTMEEGTVLRWLKQDGELVRRGEELVEIETDKAAMVYESDQEGILRLAAREGDTLPVGATIAHVGEGEANVPPDAGVEPQRPNAEPHATQRPSAEPHATMTAGTGPITAVAESAAPAAATAQDDGEARVKASPLARRLASERGIDLRALTGSGPGGRIVKADVETAAAAPALAGAPPPVPPGAPAPALAGTPAPALADTPAPALAGTAAPAPPTEAPAPPAEAPTLAERVATAKGETTEVELSRTQQTVARRMAESKATIPDFALLSEVDMEKCVALRSELKRLSPEGAPTYNDMVVKASALALREYPRANSSYRDGRLLLHSRVNVGVAVATDEALVVPTVFDADLKSLGEIAREARALAERVRAGTITPPELGGGTFTVSNLGMYGVQSFAAIINPPQVAILSVGVLAPRAVVRDGAVLARHTLAMTLVCDHRVLYGADAARFLARIGELLEEPAALTL